MDSDPVVEVGNEMTVYLPVDSTGRILTDSIDDIGTVDGEVAKFHGEVISTKKKSKMKNNSNFEYKIRVKVNSSDDGSSNSSSGDGDFLEIKTRLLHLKWKLRKEKRKKCSHHESHEVDSDAVAVAPVSSTNDSSSCCLTEYTDHPPDALDNTSSKKKKKKTKRLESSHIESSERDDDKTQAITASSKASLPNQLPDYRYILAPMVGASELAFRLLCRRYGATLAYTPMINSGRFAAEEEYRKEQFETTPEDRPLVAHFAANDAKTLLAAARHVEHRCDAIDINLGCPQRIAFAGHFGSYLLGEEDRETVLDMVRTCSAALSIPLFVKIRILDTVEDTVRLCEQLIEAGASLIAIHGRFRVNLVGRTGAGARDGAARLDFIRDVKAAIDAKYGWTEGGGGGGGGVRKYVPIIANGNIITFEDCEANKTFTGADGVMSAEGILDDPALFFPALAKLSPPTAPTTPPRFIPSKVELAKEYLSLVRLHPVKLKSVVFHIRRMCRSELTRFQLLEDCVAAESVDKVEDIINLVGNYLDGTANFHADKEKEKQERERQERRKREEGKRKDFEARMVRKAKREGLSDLSHYLKEGSQPPTYDELAELRAMPEEQRFESWKARFKQHCFGFHFYPDGCARDRTCSFLHADVKFGDSAYG